MIKVIAFIRGLPELSRAEFLRFWQEEHPPLVLALPGIRGYRQNPATDRGKGWPWDGAAELWFDDTAAVKVAYAGPEADALRTHEEHFISDISWFLAQDRPIWFDERHDPRPASVTPAEGSEGSDARA